MGLIITPQQEIEKYYESSALNQSSLKDLLNGFDNFLSNQREKEETGLYYEENQNFIDGAAVDIILTGEEGQFENSYYVSQIDVKPSDVEMSIIQQVFDNAVNEYKTVAKSENIEEMSKFLLKYPLSFFEDFIQDSIESHNWQSRWKMDTKINKIIDVGSEYFTDLCKAYGKQVISSEDMIKIQNITESLRTNEITAKYFDREFYKNNKDVDIYYQLPIYFTLEEIDCKALLDIVIVEKQEGVITKIIPLDLKTMAGNTLHFPSSLRRFRYDIQGCWYEFALMKYFNTKYHNIDIENFKFIVESKDMPGRPLIYEMSDELMNVGYSGLPEVKIDGRVIGREIKGIKSLIEEYKYYENTNWKEDKILQEKGRVLKIDWNEIK